MLKTGKWLKQVSFVSLAALSLSNFAIDLPPSSLLRSPLCDAALLQTHKNASACMALYRSLRSHNRQTIGTDTERERESLYRYKSKLGAWSMVPKIDKTWYS